MKNSIYKTAFMALLTFLLAYGPADHVKQASGSDASRHIVVKGDTLWDVTRHYLDNPFFWPKVWQYNPQINNPHRIYPGDTIRIPSREELARMGSIPKENTPSAGIPLLERGLLESSGFIIPDKVKIGEGKILSSWEEKTYLTDRDTVHINLGRSQGVKPGDLFQVLQVHDEVVHPVTGGKIGRQVTVEGILKVLSVNDKLSTARIIRTYTPIRVGDVIRTYHPLPLIGREDLTREDKSIQGVIIQSTLGKKNLAVRDMVYIDVGTEESVSPGDRFLVYRNDRPSQVRREEARKAGIEEFPPEIMGELVVLKTMARTATALIVQGFYEITPGDRIKYIPRSLPPIKKYDLD